MFPCRVRAVVAVVVACVAASLLGPGVARASQTLGDLDVSNLSLSVNGKGEALVSYTAKNGRRRHVLASGAVNARPPSANVPQVRFEMDYSGGLRKHHNPGYWTRFHGRCPSYHGPPLVYVVAACTAPDGSYWAVQAWQKNLPMRGIAPFRPEQASFVFNLSHWTGPTAVLEVSQNFTYGGTWTGLFGRMTYAGAPVFGYRTPSSSKRGDGYARYVYIDTHNSAYGPGWRHDAAKVLHLRNGAFCYSFVPQVPPPGYPDRSPRGPGNGDFERVTVMGPGVTPDVQWVGRGLGAYDPVEDEAFNALFDRLVGPDDQVCKNER